MSTPQITGLGIHLKVKDVNRSRAFYESLGFKPVFAYGDDAFRATLPEGVGSAPERYRGMTFAIGDTARLEIADGHIAVKTAAVFQEPVTSPKISAMVNVDSLVPVLQNSHVTVTFPVRHYYWGTIEAAFRDPDGFVLVFIAKHTDEEFQRVSQLTKIEVIHPGGV